MGGKPLLNSDRGNDTFPPKQVSKGDAECIGHSENSDLVEIPHAMMEVGKKAYDSWLSANRWVITENGGDPDSYDLLAALWASWKKA